MVLCSHACDICQGYEWFYVHMLVIYARDMFYVHMLVIYARDMFYVHMLVIYARDMNGFMFTCL